MAGLDFYTVSLPETISVCALSTDVFLQRNLQKDISVRDLLKKELLHRVNVGLQPWSTSEACSSCPEQELCSAGFSCFDKNSINSNANLQTWSGNMATGTKTMVPPGLSSALQPSGVHKQKQRGHWPAGSLQVCWLLQNTVSQ